MRNDHGNPPHQDPPDPDGTSGLPDPESGWIQGSVARTVLAAADAEPDPGRIPKVLCRTIREGMTVDGCSMSFFTESPNRQLVCASNEVALRLERVQFETAEGPCVSAAATGEVVAVRDLHHHFPTPWPVFSSRAVEELPDVGAVYGFPLTFGTHVMGAIDLYRRLPGALTEEEVARGRDAAGAAALVLLATYHRMLAGEAVPVWEPEEVIRAHWADAHTAVGVLAARRGTSHLEALAHVRARAFGSGRAVPDVVQEILREA
ncbi:GAF domain-containing protein [Streptomyces sp. NPDC051561]|uniref:GAF domain-containing protein n=1 Tax=Streptomyces sp. NPDC051561 TaxID=3365658 RepID=UPI0037987A96